MFRGRKHAQLWAPKDDVDDDGRDEEDEEDEPEGGDDDDEEEDDRGDDMEDDAEDDGSDDDDDEDGSSDDEDDDDQDDDDLDPEAVERVARDGSTVPRARLNEVISQNKQLLSIIERMQAGEGKPKPKAEDEEPSFDVEGKLADHAKLITEGEFDKAKALMNDVLKHVSTGAERRAVKAAVSEVQARLTEERAAETAEQILDELPYLDPEAKGHNRDALEDFELLRDGMRTKGVPVHTAMRRAAARIKAQYGSTGKGPDRAPKRTGRLPKARDGDAISRKRDELLMRRNAGLSRRIPASLHESGKGGGKGGANDVSTIDIERMTEAQFDKLSPKAKARLRGDLPEEDAPRRRSRRA